MLHFIRTSLPIVVLAAGPAMAQDSDGAAIFEENCAGCHGADSELSAASMAGLEQSAFADALAGHPEVGGGLPDLDEEQIAALHAYVAEQGGQ